MNLICKNLSLIAATSLALTAPTAYASEAEVLNINLKASQYMKMNWDITRIAVGSPEIATVVQLPSSNNEFLIVTHGAGSTTLFVWTADKKMHEYLINVSPEDTGQARLIEEAIGLPNVRVKMVDKRVLLTGTVKNQYERNYAVQTARLFVGSGNTNLSVGSNVDMTLETQTSNDDADDLEASKTEDIGNIIDLLQVLHPTQIKLEAQIIEINSDNAKDLGIQYGTSGSGGIFSFGENYNRSHTSVTESSSNSYNSSNSSDRSNSYSNTRNTGSGTYNNNYDYDYTTTTRNNGRNGSNNYDGSSSSSRSVVSTFNDIVQFRNNPLKWIGQNFGPINATITALVSKGKAKVLSRPNITTMSGEQATIQIGGQIPYTARSSEGWSTEFKDYGIILQFKPIVDSKNRITSMVHTEVSNMSGQSVDGQPIIATRRADSVITLNSGSTIVIGGLMDSSESKSISKIPLLGDIPILGELFKYNSKHKDKRELIILVTPYLVEEDDLSTTKMSNSMKEFYDKDKQEQNSMNQVNVNESPEKNEAEIKNDENYKEESFLSKYLDREVLPSSKD